MKISVVTLFPEFFESPLKTSILGRGIESGALSIEVQGLRPFGEGPYRAVDDKPFGGGAGMVLMPTVVEKALGSGGLGIDLDVLESSVQEYRASSRRRADSSVPLVVALTPQGKKLNANLARKLAASKHVVLLCGHYEGFDERVLDAFAHEEVSVGDYVLTGGEPAALIAIDAISRFVPGVVGKAESVEGDTFGESSSIVPGGLKYPHYTRPQNWRGREVPSVLLSGHHENVRQWRLKNSEERTRARRPDLLADGEAVEYPTYVVLLHSPMLNKSGDEVCTAVTNLDLHDIARSCRTYGVQKYFVVNPEPEQERLVARILGHWHENVSKVYHPARAEALSGIQFSKTFQEVLETVSNENAGQKPFVVMPDARDLRNRFPGQIPSGWQNPVWTYEDLRERLINDTLYDAAVSARPPLVIVFGTGWGIAPSFFSCVDQPLAPLQSNKPYNHLSVRGAAAIVLDRIFGKKRN